MGKHCAAGKNLYVISAVVGKLTNDLPHFPRSVGLSVVQIPRQKNVRSKSSGRASSARDGDVRARHEHVRANDIATLNGVAKSYVAESAIGAYVAHGSKSGFKHDACVGHRLQCDPCSRLLELVHGFRIMRAIS